MVDGDQSAAKKRQQSLDPKVVLQPWEDGDFDGDNLGVDMEGSADFVISKMQGARSRVENMNGMTTRDGMENRLHSSGTSIMRHERDAMD